jgi:hypothetical protein
MRVRSLAPRRQAKKPESRIVGAFAAQHCDAEIGCCEQGAANRVYGKRACVDSQALDQQVWHSARRSHVTELAEQSSADEGEMEVPDTLPLDEGASPDHVVAGYKPPNGNTGTKSFELGRNAAELLTDVCDDCRLTVRRHRATVASRARLRCTYSSYEVRRK